MLGISGDTKFADFLPDGHGSQIIFLAAFCLGVHDSTAVDDRSELVLEDNMQIGIDRYFREDWTERLTRKVSIPCRD